MFMEKGMYTDVHQDSLNGEQESSKVREIKHSNHLTFSDKPRNHKLMDVTRLQDSKPWTEVLNHNMW